jgi:polysaccharide chain length determinant protein (PEP-CTERM system associated)
MISEILDQVLYYLDALWRRRWLALCTAFAVALGGWAYVAQMPDEYESSARIYVDTKSVLGPLLRGMTVDDDIQRQLAIMRETLTTRANLKEVARRTDLDLQVTSEEEMDALLARLEANIAIGVSQNDIYTVSYTGGDPEKAKEIVDAVTTIFVENNLGESRSDLSDAQAFLRRQVENYEERLRQAENRVAKFKQENADLLPSNSTYGSKLDQVQATLAELRSKLADARASRNILRQELEATPEMLTQQGGGLGPPSRVDARIMELRARIDDLRSRYTEKHPDVQTAQRKLERLLQEKQAAMQAPGSQPPGGVAEGPQASAGTNGAEAEPGPNGGEGGVRIPNPTYSNLKLQLVDKRSQIEALRQQIARTEKELATLQEKQNQVPEVQAKLQQLNRDYNVVKSRYETLLSRLETAQMSEQRNEQADQVEFRMIDPPQVPNQPTGPNRPVLLAGVFVFACGAGGGIALLLGFLKTSYGSVNHLRRDYDVPIIGTISKRPSARERFLGVVDRVGFASASVGFVACLATLLVIDFQYGLATMAAEVDPGALTQVLDRVRAVAGERVQ